MTTALCVPDQDDDDFFDRPSPQRPTRRACVQCCVCGKEARIPILADAKICDACLADLPNIQARIERDLEAAVDAAFRRELDLQAAIEAASAHDQERYTRALALRAADDPRIATAWARALRAGDGLAALLAAHDAQIAAETALSAAVRHGDLALAEIAKAQDDGGKAPRAVGH